MHSKMVADRQKLSQSLESSALIHAEDVEQRATQVLSRFLDEGEMMPDLQCLQRLVGRYVAHARAELTAIDRRHIDEIVTDRRLRRQRDDAASRLRRTILRIRDSFDGAYRPGLCEEVLGFGTRIPQDAMLLRQLAVLAIENMRAEDFELPPMELEGIHWSTEDFIRQLDEPLQELEEAQERLSYEDRKSNKTIKLKNESISEFDNVSRRGARFLEGLYTLVEEDLWASRVRPGARRGGSGGEGEDEAGGEEEPEIVVEDREDSDADQVEEDGEE